MTTTTSSSLPHWDFSNVYSGLDAPEFTADIERLAGMIASLDNYLEGPVRLAGAQAAVADLAQLLGTLVERFNETYILAGTLRAFLTGYTAVDSFNTEARRIESQYRMQAAKLDEIATRIEVFCGQIEAKLPELFKLNETAAAHAFGLQEAAQRSRYRMSPAEESLAAEMSLSGGRAWDNLQSTVTSQLSVDFELDGKLQKLAMPALINLRSHPDEDVRRRGFEAEKEAWASISETLAAAMNGVKGETITLCKRRGRPNALHLALEMARMDRATLDAMLGAMVDSLPTFRAYFQAKARRIGKEKLAWWDLFAPVGKNERFYTWEETQSFILENFASFSNDLAGLAQTAFERRWIDAESRPGKRGGAFCMSVPAVKESRVLSNFDGSLDQISTVAHELGHAYHNHCIFGAGKTPLQSLTPMTLAETASIMNETIVQEAILSRAGSDEEALSILETGLIGDSQVIVDIYSRFLFEQEVFARREKAELSVAELNEIMAWSQKEAYGDALDERFLQPYMWTWKPHYYDAELPYYNFPYAFGLLFGVGLYAIYQQRGDAFVADYRALLASTGEADAASLASRFGIDIRQKEFWAGSLAVIGKRIARYVAIA